MAPQPAATILAHMLRDYGTTHFFNVPVISPAAVKAMAGLGITSIVAHGEKAAAYMADGYARVSGRPGVCGCQAIGATNLAAGLRDAWMARTPVIAFSGGPESATRHKNLYQEFDDMPIFDRLTKFNAVIDLPERLPDLVRQAFRAATTGAHRPVHLELAGFWGSVGAKTTEAEGRAEPLYGTAPAVRSAADPGVVAEAAMLLAAAERPLVLAGAGVIRSRAEGALRDLVKRWRIPVVTSLNGKGAVPDDGSLALALGVAGDYARDCANKALFEADVVLVVGSSLGSMTTRNWTLVSPEAKLLHIDIDALEIGRNYPGSLPLVGDAKMVIEQLIAAPTPPPRPDWLSRVAGWRSAWIEVAAPLERSEAVPIRPETLVRILGDAAPRDAIIVADTGHAGAWAARHLSLGEGHTFLRAAGSLGWSFPAAIGAKCAAPDRTVICFTGDGGFFYHMAEMETARRYGLSLVVVVNNNVSMNQERFLWDEGDVTQAKNWQFEAVDLAALARSFGWQAERVDEPTRIGPALAEAARAGGPMLLDVRTDPEIASPPSWAPPKAKKQAA
jgi:acetolactate synthase I/II/III large subunit